MGRLHQSDFSGFAEDDTPTPMTPELQKKNIHPSNAIESELRGSLEKIAWKHYDPEASINVEEMLDEMMPLITTFKASVEEERDRQFDPIFRWLTGEEGDFPNLAEKPHYRFRTELRARLAQINYKPLTNQ